MVTSVEEREGGDSKCICDFSSLGKEERTTTNIAKY